MHGARRAPCNSIKVNRRSYGAIRTAYLVPPVKVVSVVVTALAMLGVVLNLRHHIRSDPALAEYMKKHVTARRGSDSLLVLTNGPDNYEIFQ